MQGLPQWQHREEIGLNMKVTMSISENTDLGEITDFNYTFWQKKRGALKAL